MEKHGEHSNGPIKRYKEMILTKIKISKNKEIISFKIALNSAK
jgi:hypothetical protein